MHRLADRLGRARQRLASVGSLEIVLLIGASEYPLTRVQAKQLERRIRRRCVNEQRRARDDDARACLQLADVLAEDIAAGASPEPIELCTSHVEGLCEYVLEEREVARAEALDDLCDALRRHRAG